MVTVGSGEYTYEPVENWAKLPPGWSFKEIGSVGVDSRDNVYVFNRGEHPMIVFDREGNFLRSFGEGLFPRAHGIFMAPDDTVWLTDDGDHTVRRCTLEGKVLLTLGIPGKPAPYMSGEPFHRCTHTTMSPQGDIYVSDGYGNSRVHKFTPDGRLLLKAVIGACDEMLAQLKATHVHPAPRSDMTVREAFNRVGADEWDTLRTRFRDGAERRAAE